ncbi:UbiX family flavin prenyltransferase [Desulforhabdus sp. TSK]|uniref:UbiX family flavin prenyltransferase n=1 Tax=Desulforhabdus sp. TSK TaxID=2925014 RepID=UPI001FC8324C|nr:UbiX family flavin prenyltransferase [Desulforhabdus sp. TSK]GKT07904.1 putative UbiX-like flavin prenyltransferase [Desulforhabdus sp. TSK]
MKRKNLVVAITGASGAPYARALLRALPTEDLQIHLVASSAGKLVYGIEIGTPLEEDLPPGIRIYDEKDFTAPIASGSYPTEGMVIVPCTMGTVAGIANGISQNLIHRAADVCLKEGRRMVIVPRETPLSRIHLTNMLRIVESGGIILPPMPGFYHRPKTIDELVHFVVARILEQFHIPQDLVPPWSPETVQMP